MGVKFKNEGKLLLLCALIGAVSGLIFWLFLLVLNLGTQLLWEKIPEGSAFRLYPLVICAAGGLIIGIFRKFFGDYPEEMMTVFGRLKKTGTYHYRKMPVLIISALLPLIIGCSVGPEAGMVGIIVALCCWAGDNLKFAGSNTAYYSRIGAAAGLSVMFRSPLFGILDVEEGSAENIEAARISRTTKFILYGIAAGCAFGCFYLLNLIYRVSEGFPSFEPVTTNTWDYVLFLVYVSAGAVLGLFFEFSEKLFKSAGKKLPPVAGELIAGVIFGVAASFLPMIRFSGEEQMGELMIEYASYAPLALIGIAFLKILLTNLCIQLGLKGGHFFPLIFAAVCLGFGISLLIFPGDLSHAAFAASASAAGTLGVSMKKPLAVSMLLLLCFPARMLLWILPAAALASFVGNQFGKRAKG